MRVFHVLPDQFIELDSLPSTLPAAGFLWVGSARHEFDRRVPEVQALLQRCTGGQIVDVHIHDLANNQLPSHYDYTSWYDMLVFRRLAAAPGGAPPLMSGSDNTTEASTRALTAVDTSPVGFAVFDRALITVHPNDCLVRDYFAQRLAQLGHGVETRAGPRLPASPADLMLRMVNHMVDSYLELRRLLTRQFGLLQRQLLDPRSRFHDWQVLLDARNALHMLEETCEDQRSAMQEWIDALDEWPAAATPPAQREHELLRVRSRDVLEHIERVLSHVRRLEQSSEASVQMHFSALSHRTNDIMRTLTVLTAIFLPLNLITGVFGMNFDSLPLIHTTTGFWIAFAMMLVVALGLGGFFWRKRYLGASRRWPRELGG
jgi:magnesium transporter